MVQALNQRLIRAQERLQEKKLDCLIVDRPIDLYYLTGLELSKGRLVVAQESAALFVDGRYFEGCQNLSPVPVKLTKWEDEETFGIEGEAIGFDAIHTSYHTFQQLHKKWGKGLVPLEHPIGKLRVVKDEEERALLREVAALGAQGYDHIVNSLREGISEKELALELELFWRKKGGERVSFEPIIAFGAHSSEPHTKVSDRRLKEGEAVLIDIGVVKSYYHSDMTRVVFFGKPTQEMERIYSVVREAQAAALHLCRPGTPIKELDDAARGVIASYGYGEYFPHSLGHGIGLETHEIPTIRKTTEGVLKAGMVITIEPGIYLPGIGGVRLEDTVVITQEGYENLTKRPL